MVSTINCGVYDTAQLSPIFCGYSFEKVEFGLGLDKTDEDTQVININFIEKELHKENQSSFYESKAIFEPSKSHIACHGFKLTKKSGVGDEAVLEENPSKIAKQIDGDNQLPAREYLEKEIFPVLMPALEAMLGSAKENNVLRWKRTKFNACDYLTEYLFNNNPNSCSREKIGLWEIPFVQRINTEKPRPPLPLSLIWTDDEAAIILQSCWRGRKVRMDSEVQELIQYQKEMREQEYDIMLKVEDFWKKHPVEDASEEAISEEAAGDDV